MSSKNNDKIGYLCKIEQFYFFDMYTYRVSFHFEKVKKVCGNIWPSKALMGFAYIYEGGGKYI